MSSSKFPADEAQRARTLARRYLRTGLRSVRQLHDYLRTHEVSEHTTRTILARCARAGQLDDKACAKLWATHLADQGYAWASIREQLQLKGLDGRLAGGVVDRLQSHDPDERRARLLVQERLARHAAASRADRFRGRLARLLARRGFDPDLIGRVLADSLNPIVTD